MMEARTVSVPGLWSDRWKISGTGHPTGNMIVAYHGGGYDGCVWEPNFAFFDKNGVLHDVGSSGYAGLFRGGKPQLADNLEKLTELVLSDEWQQDNDATFYSLTPSGVRSMFNRYRRDFCLHVMKEIEDLADDSPGTPCSCCGEFGHPEDMVLPEECGRGDGGVGIIIDDVVCMDCYSRWTCMSCDQFCGEGNLDNHGLCDSCFNEIKRKLDLEREEEGLTTIEEMEQQIDQGRRILEAMLKLNPKFADKYNSDFGKFELEHRTEIDTIITNATGY